MIVRLDLEILPGLRRHRFHHQLGELQVGDEGDADVRGAPADDVAVGQLLAIVSGGDVDDQIEAIRCDVLEEGRLAPLVDLVQAYVRYALVLEEARRVPRRVEGEAQVPQQAGRG